MPDSEGSKGAEKKDDDPRADDLTDLLANLGTGWETDLGEGEAA